MQQNPMCPLCAAQDWERLVSRAYLRHDAARLSAFEREMLDVLFDVWFPGTERVTLHSALCRTCGFVTLLPRPEESDLQAKYHYLAKRRGPSDRPAHPDVYAHVRAARIYRLLRRLLPRMGGRLLDFGGEDGSLLTPFVAAGHEGDLIDYFPSSVAGVRRLGASIEDVPPGTTYDVVLCVFVLEHLSDPAAVLHRLRPVLKDEGHLYVQVPLQLWKVPPLPQEPVSHLNFFAPHTLSGLLRACGYRVLRCGTHPTPYGSGAIRTVTALAAPGSGGMDWASANGASLTREYFHPGVLKHLQYAWAFPGKVLNPIRRLVRRSGPESV